MRPATHTNDRRDMPGHDADGPDVPRENEAGSGDSFRALTGSLIGVYLLAGIGLFIPLLTIPYLARVLKPDAWGRVLCAQAVAMLFVVIVEYGFNLSGTRDVASSSGDRTTHQRIVSDVFSAKLCSMLVVIVIGFVAHRFMPIFHGHGLVLSMAVLWGIAGGLNVGWYFQGTHRPVLALTIDMAARLSGAAAIVFLVQSPQDDWLVLALNSAVALLALLSSFPLVVYEVGWPRISLSGGWATIKRAGPLASYLLCAGIRNSSNRVVLGFLSSPAVVAIFGNAERFTDLITRASEPASRVIYPLLCEKATADPSDAKRTFLRTALLLGVITGTLSICAIVFATPIIRLLFGPGYEQSVPVLRILAVVPVLKVADMLVNTFWAQPHGLDRHMTPGVLLASAVGVVLAVILVKSYAAVGMAMAAIGAELVFLAWSVGFLALRGKLPFSLGRRSLAGGDAAVEPILQPAPNCAVGTLAVEDSTSHQHRGA